MCPGMVEAGIIESEGRKVRLFQQSELPTDWDPASDARFTVWEATHHLIKRHDEQATNRQLLFSPTGFNADKAKNLAYRLYTICERKIGPKTHKSTTTSYLLGQNWKSWRAGPMDRPRKPGYSSEKDFVMAISNRDRVQNGLSELKKGLVPFVERELKGNLVTTGKMT